MTTQLFSVVDAVKLLGIAEHKINYATRLCLKTLFLSRFALIVE